MRPIDWESPYLVVCSCDGVEWSQLCDNLDRAIEYWSRQMNEVDPGDERQWLDKYVRDEDNWSMDTLRCDWDGEQSYTWLVKITGTRRGDSPKNFYPSMTKPFD